jgi:phage gp36-like protein
MSDTRSTASARAARHLEDAIAAIDAAMGQGYAAKHPELIAALVQASAIEHAVETGRIASRETNETLLKLKPRLFG